jgi:hypothetical protein
MLGIGEGFIFKLEVLSITSKAPLVGIFQEVESLVLHKHPKNTIIFYFLFYNFSKLL